MSRTFVLLHGESGTGKSTLAKEIAAPNGLVTKQQFDKLAITFDHKSFTSPLYEIFNIKKDTRGVDQQDRLLWTLNLALSDIFPPYSISYEEFVEAVYDAFSWPIEVKESPNGGFVKDRAFLTGFADYCHEKSKDPFANRLIRHCRSDYSFYRNEFNKENENSNVDFRYVVIVSDLRFVEELKVIEREQGLMGPDQLDIIKIKLVLDPAERDMRLIEREGSALSEEELKHKTQISPFNDSEFDYILDTGKEPFESQVNKIKNLIIGRYINQK